MEEFRKVNNYSYFVSNLGNIRNDSTGQIMRPQRCTKGYYYFKLYKFNKPIYI